MIEGPSCKTSELPQGGLSSGVLTLGIVISRLL